MMLQPILPLFVLAPVTLLALAAIAWLCTAACQGLCRSLRMVCVTLAALAAAGVMALLLNPGHVEQRPSAHAPVWLAALDVSASMAAPAKDVPGAEPRIAAARRALARLSAQGGREIRWLAVSQTSERVGDAESLAAREPQGKASNVLAGLAGEIESLRRQGRIVAGAVLISDGRDTQPQAWQELVARAGAACCPVHVVPLGETWQAPDLAVRSLHPFIHAYPGVETGLSARIRNTRMGNLQLVAELADDSGAVLQTQVADVPEGKECEVTFKLVPREGAYTVRVAPQNGETRTDNNAVRLAVRAVPSRIRVFLAEGAPYWDSKFLAQYLRGQQVFDVRSVHRLSDKRFYHINSGDDDSTPTETPEMPMTLEGLMGYDVIVLGKGMEHLLDADAVQALQSWVKEQGGILVLARGRCYAGLLEGMEELEPFIWGGEEMEGCCLEPTEEGADSGLFGQLLPGAASPIWATLPALDDVRSVTQVRPRTRVLAKAENADSPMLGLMRHGLGAVACVNGEGLWKWDFYPEARAEANMYREFWRRFLPWVQTAAEFMPGFDLSLHPDRSIVAEGEGVTCLLGWRGVARPQEVVVQAVSLADGRTVATCKAAPVASAALPRWECSLGALPPGEYLLRAAADDSSQPECHLTVLPRPMESDNLNADAALLVKVAEATGGLVLPAEPDDTALGEVFAFPEGVQAMEDVYCPLWTQWQALAAISLCFGLLWFIRRRKGLP